MFVNIINAQIEKGNWMVGGSGSYKTSTTFSKITNTDATLTFLRLEPTIGYFFVDNFASGLNTSFYYNPIKDDYNLGYGFGPFIKYYFRKSDKVINIFAQSSYLYFVDNNQNTLGGRRDFKNNSLSFKAGPVIFFNDSVALELAIEYLRTTLNKTLTVTDIGLNIGFQIHLKK